MAAIRSLIRVKANPGFRGLLINSGIGLGFESVTCEIGEDCCTLLFEHEVDLTLCADLESVADNLPNLPSDAELRRLTERMQAAAARWGNSKVAHRLQALEQALECRLLDAIHAEDVVDALWSYWRGGRDVDAEKLAYMLRALFDGRRRAMVIERLALGCATCQSSAIN
jgi:hypothetical protein